MEELTALFCLWASGLGTKSGYTEKLDELFMQNPEDDLLLELEGLTGDSRGTLAKLHINEKNADKFGKILCAGAEKYYMENVSGKPEELEPFTKLSYKLWSVLLAVLPFELAHSDPFCIFGYADDPLSWGDREQTIELYQKAFDHYKHTDDR